MLLDVLRYLVPNVQCTIVGEPVTADQYANAVTWQDDRPQPSWSDIEAAAPTVTAAQQAAQVQAQRHAAYMAEADPLFFKWQRGEATEQAWLDKVAEIRARYSDG